jgi:two-component system sensor kinase
MLARDNEAKLDEEGKRKLNIIRANAQRMGQLIDDLLSLSRLGHQAMSHCAIEMKDLAEEVWKELSVLNPGINVKLRFGPSPCAYGDRTLVKQVIFNLLSNAVKFTAARRDGVVEIGGCGKENEALFYVKDNGVGFDMQYYDKLFGIFQRLHDPREYDGMGVGLAIVQRVIHRHGGRVWAEGKVGEGAVFYFTLPEKR